ncbi:hypothetical protein [Winogradskyella flava]|jgi:hypothetical protein|uniref:hypothetical protein n=1 Tax=Winogradskyella flava TaxID=1884876 RepID=UPI002490B1DD|nr:hypothetical protein [Winogradskyella flava]
MKLNCKKCGNEINKLNLNEVQRFEILGMIQQDLKLFAIKKLIDDFGFNHKEAKVIVTHINSKNGKCQRCDYDELENENAECPKCGAFNYNLKEPVFNSDFCTHLEWKLDFENLGIESLKRYWCDGVDTIPYDVKSLSKENIEKNKSIITRAWIGEDGQGVYEMEIKLGEQSVENYKKELSLIDCIPDKEDKDWIKIEPENNRIQVYLK